MAEFDLLPKDDTMLHEDLLFNLRKDRRLALFVKMKKGIDSDSKIMIDISKDNRMRRQVLRSINTFIGGLCVPTYNNMQNYNFNDTLASFA